jgi:hypothetical protein
MHFREKRILKNNHCYILKDPLNYRLGVRLDRTFLNFYLKKNFKLIFFIVLMLKIYKKYYLIYF